MTKKQEINISSSDTGKLKDLFEFTRGTIKLITPESKSPRTSGETEEPPFFVDIRAYLTTQEEVDNLKKALDALRPLLLNIWPE